MSTSANAEDPSAYDSDVFHRTACRAAILRVLRENPNSSGLDLFLRFWAAYALLWTDDDVVAQQVFQEEVIRGMGWLESSPTVHRPARAPFRASQRELYRAMRRLS